MGQVTHSGAFSSDMMPLLGYKALFPGDVVLKL